jgi:lambda family phage portal protein
MLTVAMSGECFVLRRIVKSTINPYGLQLQVLEPEFLDTSKNEEGTSARIASGIQYDAQGRRAGYWLYTTNPADDPGAESKLIPLSELIYVYDPDRPGQHRGVPFSASVILKVKDLDDYDDAELYGKKIAACYAGFRTNANPERMDGAADEQGDEIERIEPGMIYKLAPGEQMQFATPPVSSSYPDFVRTHRQAIAAGMGITYEQLTGDYSNVNFSSGRMGWIEFSRNVEAWQWHMLIPMFCARVYDWFLTQVAIARGITPGPGMRVDWTPPRREMIDPVKEVAGMTATMQAGLQSWSETVRQMGYLPEQVFEEIKADIKNWKEAQLSATFNPALTPAKPQQAKAQGEE